MKKIVVFASGSGSNFQTIVDKLQKIAENYLFDAKILALIDFEEEINKMCEIGVDGVIYGSILKFNELEQI